MMDNDNCGRINTSLQQAEDIKWDKSPRDDDEDNHAEPEDVYMAVEEAHNK
jgi:hypothetical protein